MTFLQSQDRVSESLRYLLCFFGFVSVALLAATTVLVALNIPILWSVDQASAAPAIAATIFNPFALLLLIAMTVLAQSPSNIRSTRYTILPMGAGTLAIFGICTSFATFMIKRSRTTAVQKVQRNSVAFEAELGTLLACAVAHVAFYTIIVVIRRSVSTNKPLESTHAEKATSSTKKRVARLSPLGMLKRPDQAAGVPTPKHRDMQATSPIMCRNSWHVTYDDKDRAPRPMGSQDRLISTRNSVDSGIGASFEKHTPICSTPTEVGEAIDAAAIDFRLRELLVQAPPTWPHGTRLETIPGSRPTSRYVTDTGRQSFASGDESAAEPRSAVTISDSDLMSSPTQSSPVGSEPSSPIKGVLPGMACRRSITQRPSRCTTPTAQEAHIHPLFRSASPVPPPVASVNTTITASPLSGQVIPIPARSLSRNRSRAPSPSLRRHADVGLTSLSRSNSTASSTPSTVNASPEFVLTINQGRTA